LFPTTILPEIRRQAKSHPHPTFLNQTLFLCPVETDYIIVGQGICGTVLSWLLVQLGKRVIVFDEPQPHSPSRVASGLINPVTGQRLAKASRIDELLPVALETYRAMERQWSCSILQPIDIIDFHPTPQASQIFIGRLAQYPEYLHPVQDTTPWENQFHFENGIGKIAPCYLLDIRKMLHTSCEKLTSANSLIAEKFDWSQCRLYPDCVRYKDIKATKIICCDGPAGAACPYWSQMPFALNKGEALIASIPGLPHQAIYKKNLKIAPWEHDLFWIGSSFEWKFNDLYPSPAFRERTEAELKKWLRLPYSIVEHLAAVRPATVQHTPFVGWHPQHPCMGILNGMGAKACSQAPFFAGELVIPTH